MRPYNPMTVLKMSARFLLAQFFAEKKCDLGIDVGTAKFYELRDAFNCLPGAKLLSVERIMRDVFFFASDDETLTKAIEAVEVLGYTFPVEFSNLKNRYDKAFYIYLNYREIWEASSLFAHSDTLSAQHWYRFHIPSHMTMKHDPETLGKLGSDISAYFWQHQQRGKHYIAEYQERHNGLQYIFVYLSDYSDIYEKWETDSGEEKLVRREECRAFNIVFIHNPEQGVIETYCMGGVKHAKHLQEAFCRNIFTMPIKNEEVRKNTYSINDLKYIENMLKPCPRLGVANPRIVMMQFSIPETKRRSHAISVEDNSDGEEIYRSLAHDLHPTNYPLDILKITKIRLLLDIMLDGVSRTMSITVQPNKCTLRSNLEELRNIGEQYLLEEGVDAQPRLF